jgi:hypothetical protein
MYQKEVRIIRRGVPREEYIQYFRTQGEETDPGRFTGSDWEVVVGEYRKCQFFNITIEEEEIIFRGPEETVEKMLNAFRVKFLRAGG